MSRKIIPPHGGDIYKASKQYGIMLKDILDFSANLNPLGIPDRLHDIITSNISNIVNYPDPDCIGLRKKITGYLGVPSENIVVGNGASEIIFLLFEVLRPKKVLIPAPSFSEYAVAADRYDSKIEYFRLKEEKGFQLNINDLINAISDDVDMLVLCNPNNPTSTLTAKTDLITLVEHARSRNITVMLDEAFIELTTGSNNNSMADVLLEYPNLFIVRAFTKVFAIPGLRLGYGLGSAKLVQAMWKRKIPWSVNTFACCIGEFLDQAGDYLEKTADWISAEKKWLFKELLKIRNLKTFEPQTNFILAKILNGRLTSESLRDLMAEKGILIRDASNFEFLDKSFFRIAVKDRESNIKVIESLKEVFKEGYISDQRNTITG